MITCHFIYEVIKEPNKQAECVFILRELMESQDPEGSRVCLDKREMKVPEDSLDPLVPLVCRSVPSLPLHVYKNGTNSILALTVIPLCPNLAELHCVMQTIRGCVFPSYTVALFIMVKCVNALRPPVRIHCSHNDSTVLINWNIFS